MNVDKTREQMNVFGRKLQGLMKEHEIDYLVCAFEKTVDEESPNDPPVITGHVGTGSLDRRLILVGQLLGTYREQWCALSENESLSRVQNSVALGQRRQGMQDLTTRPE